MSSQQWPGSVGLAFWAWLRLDRIARVHLAGSDRRIADLSAMRKKPARVIRSWSHGTVAKCIIIETLTRRPHG